MLPNKSSHNTSHDSLEQILSRLGACIECLINQGSKFRREFQDLLDHALIDHHQISRDHPHVDGLIERMVQTCKKGLLNICFTRNKEDWDLALLCITMGYKMSKHAFLFHFDPYFIFFGKHPIPPSSIIAQMDQVVDLDYPATWVRVIIERAALFKRVVPMAMENLFIALHRNTLWYTHTQGGNYKPKVKQFNVGDFESFQQQPNDTLDISSVHIILKSKSIRPSGVLELQGMMDTQFMITPKIVRLATYRTWILPSSCRFVFLHLNIHVRYVRG